MKIISAEASIHGQNTSLGGCHDVTSIENPPFPAGLFRPQMPWKKWGKPPFFETGKKLRFAWLFLDEALKTEVPP